MLDDFIVETRRIGLDTALVDGFQFRTNDADGDVGEQGAPQCIGKTHIEGMQRECKRGTALSLIHGRRNLGQGLLLLGG
jgi:hypothetical protein